MSTLRIGSSDGLGTFEYKGKRFLVRLNNNDPVMAEYDSVITLTTSEFTSDIVFELASLIKSYSIKFIEDSVFFNELIMNQNLLEYEGFEDISDLNLQKLDIDTIRFLQNNSDLTPFPVNIWLSESKKFL